MLAQIVEEIHAAPRARSGGRGGDGLEGMPMVGVVWPTCVVVAVAAVWLT